MRGPRGALIAAVLLIAVAGIVAVQVAGGGSAGRSSPIPTRAPSIHVPSGSSAAARDPASGLPTIARSALPREARATLDLIAAGGPFPYEQDGSTYQNRERLLPSRPAGAYREYTVATPGSADRGARRIVTASTGEAYWTPDHYASFARILP
ncbi:MAG: ribonuclease [Chloroflexi bacterium]|nr:ribonuclease [Chloroflexota bacterium]